MQTSLDKITKLFLIVGKIEGYSYLVLLFIAMPLKYIFHIPDFIKPVGTCHGVLFVLFVSIILIMLLKTKLSLKNAACAFLLSLVPFGTFYLHKTLK